ncbi:antitoxin Xre/MbcA/ParS toxin-binding domain-containing protein [Legionella feeleii]|uniref:Uncharacterized conserved protein n=1 Tax=Legionella feeleii TaxID=453 RepID=A0A0W0U5M8_9GAMM|nr:antitoxin Xre/MbcA/ParS toxin-binding domain-containing protein [Legionella feeleii]KTD03125.1 hypothetical protein Lfee_0481 [Legionella feeleii]SPX61357.1 Uncharacterized conserved protein [Legionella feeleii]
MRATQLINNLKDPIKEIKIIREGVSPELIEHFLNEWSFFVKDILNSLQIPKSTYFAKKRTHALLDPSTTEKFLRLISVAQLAKEVIGKNEAKNWLYRPIPSLGDQAPMDLLDTEVGHRLVEQTLMQIKYGIYG